MTGRLPEDSLKMPGQVCLVGEPGRRAISANDRRWPSEAICRRAWRNRQLD
jgi:hypothetical protein